MKLEGVQLQINGSDSAVTPSGITLERRELWVGNDNSLWVGNPTTGIAYRIVAGSLGDALKLQNNGLLLSKNMDASGATISGAEVTGISKMTVDSSMYGSTLPTDEDAVEGQLFFKLL